MFSLLIARSLYELSFFLCAFWLEFSQSRKTYMSPNNFNPTSSRLTCSTCCLFSSIGKTTSIPLSYFVTPM